VQNARQIKSQTGYYFFDNKLYVDALASSEEHPAKSLQLDELFDAKWGNALWEKLLMTNPIRYYGAEEGS
jgi:hypothetical protein